MRPVQLAPTTPYESQPCGSCSAVSRTLKPLHCTRHSHFISRLTLARGGGCIADGTFGRQLRKVLWRLLLWLRL